MTLALAAYRLLGDLALPVLHLALARRASRGKEDPARRLERRGIASRPRPFGPLAWVHCASVGEALNARREHPSPLVREHVAWALESQLRKGSGFRDQ